MPVDSTSTLETFVAVGALVAQCPHMPCLVVSECPKVLQDLVAQLAGEGRRVKVGFINRFSLVVKTDIDGCVRIVCTSTAWTKLCAGGLKI